jgi:hypothetical protein
MTPLEQRRERRRARVRELRDEGLSVREIACKLEIGRSTVARDIAVAPERGQMVPNAAGPSNERALKHGAYSERRIGPVREEHARDLAERYAWIDPARRALQSQRLAQIDLGSAWLDEQGGVVRNAEGHVFDIADKLSRWLGQAEAWFERAEGERRGRARTTLADFIDGNGTEAQ